MQVFIKSKQKSRASLHMLWWHFDDIMVSRFYIVQILQQANKNALALCFCVDMSGQGDFHFSQSPRPLYSKLSSYLNFDTGAVMFMVTQVKTGQLKLIYD